MYKPTKNAKKHTTYVSNTSHFSTKRSCFHEVILWHFCGAYRMQCNNMLSRVKIIGQFHLIYTLKTSSEFNK